MEKLSYKSALLVLLVLLVLRGASTAHAVTMTEFLVPTANAGLRGITAGPDGNLWFTQAGSDKIGRISPAGVITEFTVPGVGSQPSGIVVGPDGNLWFTEAGSDQIGRITTGGALTEFTVPGVASVPVGITTGPDGSIWFTQFNSNQIGRLDPDTTAIPEPSSVVLLGVGLVALAGCRRRVMGARFQLNPGCY